VLVLKHGRSGGLVLKFDKVEVSSLIVLFIGVILLIATFYSAFMFLAGDIAILTSADLAELFGNALAPLIVAIIHVLYLGVMGWIGSIMTIRAVQLLKKEKETASQPQPKPNTAPTSPQAQTKPESKKQESIEKTTVQPQPQEPSRENPPSPPENATKAAAT